MKGTKGMKSTSPHESTSRSMVFVYVYQMLSIRVSIAKCYRGKAKTASRGLLSPVP